MMGLDTQDISLFLNIIVGYSRDFNTGRALEIIYRSLWKHTPE